MKLLFLLLLLTVLSLCTTASRDAKPTVKIGIKKRAEKCEMKAGKGDTIHVHYRGTLKDGTEFDSSYGRQKPFSLKLGIGQVIKGWEQGLLGMCEGEKRRLVIPPELGYGKAGAGDKIPPDSTLIFEVELEKIDRPKSDL
ncbi:peptidyl-prolyl cis-trans isomerase FKBP2 [Rhagoletis pomonella]|uniref:peptidyl-prolyl cis-trans isomerase FKBP2 n=1 Tax=Rhagoletis pomonella TaxID=28610 RepID=UPI00177ACB7B|nr:peptidyl-prolyl cis-trans isomerase FKBP2 [Rhagoletis pomonella]